MKYYIACHVRRMLGGSLTLRGRLSILGQLRDILPHIATPDVGRYLFQCCESDAANQMQRKRREDAGKPQGKHGMYLPYDWMFSSLFRFAKAAVASYARNAPVYVELKIRISTKTKRSRQVASNGHFLQLAGRSATRNRLIRGVD